jgi:hypothetical protein
MCHI